MQGPFSSSLRALAAERGRGLELALALALALLLAWGWWMVRAEVALVEVSVRASVESVAAAVPVTTLVEGRLGDPGLGLAGHAEVAQAATQRREEVVAAGPLAKRIGWHGLAVHEDPAQERGLADEGAAAARVHELHPAGARGPQDHEVGHAARREGDDDRRRGCGLGQQQVVDGQHHLLGVEAERDGDLLEGVDRGAVDVGLTGLAQAAVGDRQAEALEQALERGRAAVHGGGLDDLDGEATACGCAGHVRGRVRSRG